MEPIINVESEFTVANEVASNDLIMEEITKHLDVSGLKNFRRVGKEWYRTSMKAWNQNAFVQIEPPIPRYGNTTGKSLQNLVQFLKETCDQNCRNFLGVQPFQNISLSSGKEKLEGQEKRDKEETMKNLWRELAQLAFHLQIKIHTGNHCLNPILQELGPNVTTLEVICTEDLTATVLLEGPAHPQVKRLKLSVKRFSHFNFLIKFPNLEELKLSYLRYAGEYDHNYNGMSVISTLRTISFSKPRRNFCNLKHLDLIGINVESLSAFVDAKLPLTFLALRLDGGDSPTDFQKSMEHYAKSLKTLKIRVTTSKWNAHTPAGFPAKINIDNLQVLEIWGYLTDNINFLKGAPHLRRLRLDLICNEVRRNGYSSYNRNLEPFKIDNARNIVENSGDLFDQPDFKLLELQELRIDFQLPEDAWKVVGRWMPNLRILEAPLDNTTFRLVCAQWPKLRGLVCRLGSEVDDDGLVGESGRDGMDASGQPTILDIKYLESFELEAPCGQGKISDRSAEVGFLKMNYLQKLKAFVSPHLVSEGVEIQLRAQIDHVEIIRNCRTENIPLHPLEIDCSCNWAAEKKRLYFESIKRWNFGGKMTNCGWEPVTDENR